MLRERGVTVTHLLAPDEHALAAALGLEVTHVAVLVRRDVEALRYVLLVEHLRPGVAVVATIFDKGIAEQIRQVVPGSTVTSPADVVVPSVVAACVGDGLAVVETDAGPQVLSDSGDGLVTKPWSHPRRGAGARLDGWLPRWHDGSTGLLIGGLGGLIAILLADWLLSVWVLHEGPLRAAYVATRIVSTVGPAEADLHQAPGWYLLLSVVLMLAAIVFTGAFVAGLVEWLVSTRSVGLVGRRAAPSRASACGGRRHGAGRSAGLSAAQGVGCPGAGGGARPAGREPASRSGRQDPCAHRTRPRPVATAAGVPSARSGDRGAGFPGARQRRCRDQRALGQRRGEDRAARR